MPSFADSIFLFVLALLLFGPKRLPVLARELGKWVGEFRRASNEFKMQMEDELRVSEQADRQKQIVAMEAAAPVPPKLEEAEPEHPHMRHTAAEPEPSILPPGAMIASPVDSGAPPTAEPLAGRHPERSEGPPYSAVGEKNALGSTTISGTADGLRPIPIAVSGSLEMMPPATGLPTPRSRNGNGHGISGDNALGGLLDSIPQEPTHTAPENVNHGD